MAPRKGNRNGQKHGLYSRRITPDESALISAFPIGDVEGEIAYQRAVISRLAEVLENNGLASGSRAALSSETRLTLKLLNDTMRSLLAYIRRHSSQGDDLHEYQRELEAGKHLARLKKNVFRYLEPPGAK